MPEKYFKQKDVKYSKPLNTTNYRHQNCKKKTKKLLKEILFFNNVSIVPEKYSKKIT